MVKEKKAKESFESQLDHAASTKSSTQATTKRNLVSPMFAEWQSLMTEKV